MAERTKSKKEPVPCRVFILMHTYTGIVGGLMKWADCETPVAVLTYEQLCELAHKLHKDVGAILRRFEGRMDEDFYAKEVPFALGGLDKLPEGFVEHLTARLKRG